MKITQWRIDHPANTGRDALPAAQNAEINPQLNVFFGPTSFGKSTAAGLLAHLLYGKSDRTNEAGKLVEGSVNVHSSAGDFCLRRQRDGVDRSKLTIAADAGNAVDGRTLANMLGGMNPTALSELYAIDFREPPRLESLLRGKLVDELIDGQRGPAVLDGTDPFACLRHSSGLDASAVDRRTIDELVRRRDKVAAEIESQFADRRTDSARLEGELHELDQALATRRRRVEHLETDLAKVAAQLAATESRLRYFTLESTARRPGANRSTADGGALEALDAEIDRCRRMLADQQARESQVRRELATLHPDGAGDGLASLADQRATLTVFERLLDDLDAEVALLARSHEPARCIGPEAHGRIHPVVEMLRQQLYTMCGQLTEQQRTVSRQRLEVEARHLQRSQNDLSEQLEHLLARRQEAVHEAQLASQPVVLLPQPPIDSYCQCAKHRDFVQHSEAMLLSQAERVDVQSDTQQIRADLERQRCDLAEQLADVQQEIAARQRRWDDLQRQRGRLVGKAPVDRLREELARLERQIGQALQQPGRSPAASDWRRDGWRASDVLAQLTDGQLTQIRLSRHSQAATIIDRTGGAQAIDQLSPGRRDQVFLAVALSLIAAHAERGIHLPLILDEPFVRQDAAGAAAMAGVLHEFATHGRRQAIVFTENHAALQRFEALGVELQAMRADRQADGAARLEQTQPPSTQTSTHVRVVRETAESAGPRLHVAEQRTRGNDDHEVYYLTTSSLLENFPVLGSDTMSLFAPLNIMTVDDLLGADPHTVAEGLDRPEISVDTVVLWQRHMSLMCFIADVSLDDAQVLTAADILSPDDLSQTETDVLVERIEQFLASDRGRRFATNRSRFSRQQLADWQRSSRRQRDRWRRASQGWGRSRRSSRRASMGRQETPTRRERQRSTGRRNRQRSGRSSSQSTVRPAAELRFFLSRSSEVADAPSIGPKTAERLAAVGIRTVADLLNADAESTAAELDVSHINAAKLAAWQHQARLVCCIPELRGYGAQLLVGCGFTEAEQIANTDLDEMIDVVEAFARSKEGQRILRDGDPPGADKITEWVDYAAQMRPLEAA